MQHKILCRRKATAMSLPRKDLGNQRVVWSHRTEGAPKGRCLLRTTLRATAPGFFQEPAPSPVSASDHIPQFFTQKIWLLGFPDELIPSPTTRSRNMAILVAQLWGTCFIRVWDRSPQPANRELCLTPLVGNMLTRTLVYWAHSEPSTAAGCCSSCGCSCCCQYPAHERPSKNTGWCDYRILLCPVSRVILWHKVCCSLLTSP